MFYHSTHKEAPEVSLEKAVLNVLAPDNGLYMPKSIRFFPSAFYKNLTGMSLQEIAFIVAETFFGEDIPADCLQDIVYETIDFDIPLVKIENNRYVLELFHGPTLSYKDIGVRFFAKLLNYLNRKSRTKNIAVLTATTGNTGCAVANNFWGIPGIHVYILYPQGKVNLIQEKQFATLGDNITAIAIDGSFEDCQTLVKQAFLDKEINQQITLTSANSINIACLLPQSFYFFYAYSQLLQEIEKPDKITFGIPSDNLGNLTAGVIAKQMGLPIKRYIATTHHNKILIPFQSSDTQLTPNRPNAINKTRPSNFERIKELYDTHQQTINQDIELSTFIDDDIPEIIHDLYKKTHYTFDPYSAVNYHVLNKLLSPNEIGITLETTHPIKFGQTVPDIIGKDIPIPNRLKPFIHSKNKNLSMPPLFADFKSLLIQQA